MSYSSFAYHSFQQVLFESDFNLYSPLATDFTNFTVANITSTFKFPQFVQNATSIANSIFFLIVYSIILLITGLYFAKATIIKKQRTLFIIMVLFVLTHVIALVFRLIYNSTGLYVNLNVSTIQKDVLVSDLKLMWASSYLENVISFLQIIPFSCFIMSFILIIFLQTVEKAGAMTKKAYNILFWLVIVISSVTIFLSIGLAVTNGTINFLSKMREIKLDVTPIYISLFVLYILLVSTELVLFLASGIRLILVIRKSSLKTSQLQYRNRFEEFMNRPYTKLVGLITGTLLCQLFAVLSLVVSIITSLKNDNLHIIDYFLHGLGVSSFAVMVLFCYCPYWQPALDSPSKSHVNTTTDISSSRSHTKHSIANESESKDTKMITSPGLSPETSTDA